MRRNETALTDAEVAAITEAFRNGATQAQLKKQFRRSHGTVKRILSAIKGDGTDTAPTQETALVLVKKKKKIGRPSKADKLAGINRVLDSSVNSTLEEPLARFMTQARRLMPHAHTIVIDLVTMRAKAHISQEVELLVGASK